MHRRVALIAYSLRFPGTDTQNLWNDLLAKKDLVTEVDSTRWSKDSFLHPDKRHPGSSYTFAAGSLGDISGFDAAFFGISPREASLMDPQQRLLLELAWETFENAGIVPSSLRGSDCGVYVGISNVDYAYRLADDLAAIDSSAATGIISSIAANRISYVFDLHGPSISMDTACSSSLVAFHQACLAIRSGEISQALAGGVNLHLHPYGFISFSKATMLSKTGRCHVFDEAGDGYVRSEGGGLFLLKDYDQAIVDGDQILAVVAGSAINTDGHKAGLTIPNPDAQAALMSRVYEQAGIAPDAIDYFEAHGTGTAVGDPIEAHAIGLALGQKRKTPLLIGSIKSNLGHLESASGVAGLVKALNCIRHRAVPATLSTGHLNPNINCADWNLRVVTETQALKATGDLIVGINSFGFGGANAHVILQGHSEATPTVKLAQAKTGTSNTPLLLSAKDISGLNQAALALADFLEGPTTSTFYDIAHTAFFRREHHQHGAVVFSDTADDAAAQLRRFANLEDKQDKTSALPRVYTGNRVAHANGPAFAYSGNGCQWHTMGKQLLEQSAVFRHTIIGIDKLFSEYADFSLLDELNGTNGNRYGHTEIAQPALFALQVGITEILREHGIQATAVIGHSVGEVAAAWAAGALSLAAAVKVIFYRSYYQGKTKGSGGMTAVALSASDMQSLLAKTGADQLHLAGINSYRGVTIAGDVDQLTMIENELAVNNTFFKRLDLDYAFHSPAMDAIESGICIDLAELDVKRPAIAFFSTVTGTQLLDGKLDAQYWWHNIRQPVQFQQAVDAMLDAGINTLVEIGAHPVLQSYLNDSFKAADMPGIVIPTVSRNNDSIGQLMNSVAQTLLSGADVNHGHWFPKAGHFVNLPNYPWQREKLWHPVTSESYGLLARKKVHPLLGYPVPQHELLWENQLDTQAQPFLNDHNVGGAVVFPGAGFVELAVAAAFQAHPDDFLEIEELEIRSPLLLSHDHSKVIRFSLDAVDSRFTLRSRELAKSSEWLQHGVGRVLIDATGNTLMGTSKLDITAPAIPKRTPDFDRASHQRLTESVGIEYGPAFQTISHGWIDGNHALGVFTLPETIRAGFDRYYLHPALLDCAFQLVFQILKDTHAQHEGMAFVPVKMGRIHLRTNKAVPAFAKATVLHRAPHSLNTEFILFDADGVAIAVINDVRFRAVRLHRQHAQHLHFLDYHLTAAPLAGVSATAPVPRPPFSGGVAPRAPEGIPSASMQSTTSFDATVKTALSEMMSGASEAIHRYSDEVEPLLDSLCDQFMLEALITFADENGYLSDSHVNGHCVNHPTAAALLRTMIAVAVENKMLTAVADETGAGTQGKGWQLNPEGLQQDVPATAIWNTLVQEYPDYFYPIHLTGRVGMQLARLLSGELQAGELGIVPTLYANVTSHILEQTAKKSLTETFLTQCQHIMQTLPTGERLRILEISAYKPEFAPLICPQLDFNQGDYCYASFCEDALNAAQGLRDHFPLLQTLHLSQTSDHPIESRATFAILNLAMGNVLEVQQMLNQLPQLLMPGSPVFLIGLQPAHWIDRVLGAAQDWWIQHEDQQLLSPQLSADAVIEQLQALPFKDVQAYEFMPEHSSGVYVLAACRDETPVTSPMPDTKNWLVLAGNLESERAFAHAITGRLRAQGHRTTLKNPYDGGSLQQELTDAKTAVSAYHHIIHLSGLGRSDAVVQTERCWLATTIVQACEASATPACVWLVTRQVGTLLPCDQDNAFFAPATIAHDAALWGFGRSLMNETSNYRVQLLDLGGETCPPILLDAVMAEFLYGDAEQEVVLNASGKRFAPRLRSRDSIVGRAGGFAHLYRSVGKRWANDKAVCPPYLTNLSGQNQTLQLSFKLPGQLRNLQWQAVPGKVPADDEIEIEVKATGLNFRDVMYTLGLLSDEAIENGFVGPTLGLEFAGLVTRTGQAVTAFKPGDQVVGLGPASFSDRVLTKANAIALIPNNIGYAAAATIPSTFFTVYYALHYQARLQLGEKVLIHGAAGGVGIAAIQIAQWLGAEIYATVGSDEKRDFLQLMGVEHIHDSRSLSFAEEILAKTGGVDVVLNSLAGEAINRNFQVLKPFGRFLELGKRDFYENTHIGLRPFRNNISYFGIDADQLMQERPELTQQLFNDMMALFRTGVLHPLPYTVFDANQVIDAFRYMQQAKQIGKIIVTYDNGIHVKPPAEIPDRSTLQLSENASYLVTGGLGGFGLRTAQWLAGKGARHLILISRSGPVSIEAKAALADFKAQGITVRTAACDVTDKAALTALLKQCDAAMPPLKGIIHAAAVIDDSLVRNLSYDQIHRVFEPKIQGALALHELTLDKSLDLFVLYSSVTTLFGNPGQANYVAANLWLEALAAYRHQQGLVATCVCWGAIDDAGYLTRNEKIKEALQSRMGGSALSAATALAVLERLLSGAAVKSALGVMEFDWRALSVFLPAAHSPKFRELALQAPNADSNDDHRADIKRLLNELSDDNLQIAFVDMLKEELSQILLVNKEKIDPNHSMYDIGLDSLMGVELMIAIEARFDVQIPVMALSEAPTLNKLAGRLITQLRGDSAAQPETADTLANINDLSQRHGSAVTAEQMSALAKAVDADSTARIIH
ncbi:MAG: SDR family NAD(P)-dependent oxidoreductase [Methylovulum sp.]|nr:SDR family NAD(P)-dependent oxidoreductase [Methylovulum sp.]